jgi:hypothetical protein
MSVLLCYVPVSLEDAFAIALAEWLTTDFSAKPKSRRAG